MTLAITFMTVSNSNLGITVPSSKAQEDLIRSTYASAGLDFSETRYFEAHGTGTYSSLSPI
jgi:acyl transferase domain-containing protein